MLIHNYQYSWRASIYDSVVTNSILLLASFAILNILRYYVPYKDRYVNVLLISCALSNASAAGSQYILQKLLAGEKEQAYLVFLQQSFWVRLGMSFLLLGCMTVICVLWYTSAEEQVNLQRKNDAEKLSRDAELYKLRHQLQPHFLFNSLNSISALVCSNPEEARKMVHQLSDFLRATLKEEEQWITVAEELRSLELYLDIEKVRFGHRLSTVMNKPDDILEMKLPPLLLQPVVENAIKFGLYDTTDNVTIAITASLENKLLKIIVTNPFDSETSASLHGTGFGLSSVKRRLYLLFARNDLVDTSASDNIFTTVLRIPQSL